VKEEMDLFQGPTDIFGIAIYHALNKKMSENENYRGFVKSLNESIVIDLDYYPLMIKLAEGAVEVTRNIENPTVIVKINTQDFLNILDAKASIMGLFLKGKMKFKKGFFKLLKVYKLFSNMVKN
jgi:putative sterol carrier protein